MQYFKTIEGMLSHQFEQDGEKDDKGNFIKATEQPMTDEEYIKYKKEKIKKRLFLIDIHYACFGIESVFDIVSDAPPIARWMIGKELKEIKPWLLSKKAIIKEIK